MKKLVLAMSVSFMMINCTSSDSVENNSTDAARVAAPNAKRHFYDNGGNDYGCRTPAVSCLDDVIISGKMSVKDFKDKMLSKESLNLLNNETLILESKDNTVTGTEYFILRKKDDNSVYEVYPTKYK